ncbi:unnamed protein product [Allacma fusca]|uniref:Uncharacterized protein n=1 Tax=Allacma fusca TaxID=39272 RepID=A0A8J2Q5Y0_9HEXA|nr:unnamed protein product [Allacma fusca]
MYSSSRHNDEAPRTTEEKWVEYGTRGQDGHSYLPALTDSAYSSNNITSSREKTVNFSDEPNYPRNYGPGPSGLRNDYSSSSTNKHVEYLTPANTTTILSSGPSSPSGLPSSSSPKVERKEFYSKASYTTLIKGGPGEQPQPTPQGFENIDSRTDRRYLEDILHRDALPEPFTPVKSTTSNYTREVINDGRVTPPPPQSEGLKTPPLIRKVLQSSSNTTSNFHSHKSTGGPSGRPPPPVTSSPVIPSYDEPPEPRTSGTRYYTSTTTTEHRENREMSPVKRFPSPNPPRDVYGGPPKRLDELMATFDDSYTETRHISGDGGGPHKPHPYGPGTHPIEPVHHSRTVRIDESATTRRIINDDAETDLRQRNVNYQNPAYSGAGAGKEPELTRNVAGPPVYYPSNQIFPKAEDDALLGSGTDDAKAKGKGKRKEKEKQKQSKGEDKTGGAVPVPVCLPVCCAAPCTIM